MPCSSFTSGTCTRQASQSEMPYVPPGARCTLHLAAANPRGILFNNQGVRRPACQPSPSLHLQESAHVHPSAGAPLVLPQQRIYCSPG